MTTTAGCAAAPAGSAPTAPASPRIVTSPSPIGPALGQPAQADNGQVQATVFEYRQQPGAWGAADVEVCVVSTAIFDVTVSRGPWQLMLPDGTAVAASLAAEPDAPQPGYPTEHRRVAPGECVRGWLTFALPSGPRPVAVQYAPAGSRLVTWALAASG
jgi:hypothetical protein